MGVPSISERLHFRWVPCQASEPTSTIVLTSECSYFVDVRILKDKWQGAADGDISPIESLDWAFAGRSHSKSISRDGESSPSPSHSVWEHQIDSRTDDPDPDEGDMTSQGDGKTLEEGWMLDPQTGAKRKYEELWHDLAVVPSEAKQRDCVVLQAVAGERKLQGLIVKIGCWCQGILKDDDDLVVERWERVSNNGHSVEKSAEQTAANVSESGSQWMRTFKVGRLSLPCGQLCNNPGSTTDQKWQADDIQWQTIEDYRW